MKFTEKQEKAIQIGGTLLLAGLTYHFYSKNWKNGEMMTKLLIGALGVYTAYNAYATYKLYKPTILASTKDVSKTDIVKTETKVEAPKI